MTARKNKSHHEGGGKQGRKEGRKEKTICVLHFSLAAPWVGRVKINSVFEKQEKGEAWCSHSPPPERWCCSTWTTLYGFKEPRISFAWTKPAECSCCSNQRLIKNLNDLFLQLKVWLTLNLWKDFSLSLSFYFRIYFLFLFCVEKLYPDLYLQY